ncbi:ADP-ribosylation/crystallin J1 [Paraflavitalea sp. CAU 1676]|uniref:ADP-ribosylation/crystallin J1 n=1 Tax=Paraflavitalea sp. CAU 1676 TaxID=3032598 RepID=UPI0023DAE400|nr:ADP-ribosylation/crystallin J1 [Paraflavitalea sp. CAU 1676]MDF2189246.1 ADP-ribosylation/crystallin J1 [Paraflavitalea sp. CAU 1676]
MDNIATTTLYRPVGPKELALIEASGFTKFPPRLLQQPIFYPVMNEEYAVQIARDWNVPASGSGYVTKFEVRSDYVSKFRVENVGGEIHNELWVPADELEEFNNNIVGKIVVTQSFGTAK